MNVSLLYLTHVHKYKHVKLKSVKITFYKVIKKLKSKSANSKIKRYKKTNTNTKKKTNKKKRKINN
ncbi:hypothetical protein HanRHA438_Chr09g0376161 [Helianthus annuus]|nr:hypothetical protein HanRHA438_Chr09g0376161 [Helianthus annuus]